MPLQAVVNRKLYIQIAEQITAAIESGEFKPGQQLPSERDLAQELGVSRPTVREALIALEVAGLVEVKIGVGAFVRDAAKPGSALPESDHSALEIMQARALVEPELAALAARHITDEGRAELAGIVAAMRGQTARREWSQEIRPRPAPADRRALRQPGAAGDRPDPVARPRGRPERRLPPASVAPASAPGPDHGRP